MSKVFIFGHKTFGGITFGDDYIENEIEYNDFPHQKLINLEKLPDFPIIIIDYDAFFDGFVARIEQLNLFAKHLIRALKKGAYVVFVHYNERFPKKDEYASHQLYEMDTGSFVQLVNDEIGFMFLYDIETKLRPINSGSPILNGVTRNHFFEDFLDKWGSSHLIFKNYGDENLVVIQTYADSNIMSFSKQYGSGKIIYLACQRNTDDEENTRKLISSLIDSVENYKAHTMLEVPDWASDPIFSGEQELVDQIKEHQEKIKKIKDDLNPYTFAKQLAFRSDDEFRKRLCDFLAQEFSLEIESIERYKEDFSVLNDKKEVINIGEAKAIKGGVTKGAVYQLFNNREEQGLDENTHGLLIVNQNLTASSWQGRDKNVDPKAYQAAAKENVLILRVIDLLRLWELMKSGKLTKEKTLGHLLSDRGWLQIDKTMAITLHN